MILEIFPLNFIPSNAIYFPICLSRHSLCDIFICSGPHNQRILFKLTTTLQSFCFGSFAALAGAAARNIGYHKKPELSIESDRAAAAG